MSDASQPTHDGACFCGAVKIRMTGEPAAMGYCHCTSCRTWSAGPVNAFSLWAPDALTVVEGGDHIATYKGSETSHRQYCTKCGGHLMTMHPTFGLLDVYAAIIPTLDFKPALHVNYAETVLPMRDGLPKFKDFPADIGGSGETIPE